MSKENSKQDQVFFTGIQIVDASAGSGKTFALVRRFLHVAFSQFSAEDPGALLRSILAITFTNKAAIEMKERIIEYIKRIAFDSFDSPEEKQNLLEALGVSRTVVRERAAALMDGIIRQYTSFQVQTIDSFVNALLMGSAFRINRSAHFLVQEDYREYLSRCFDMLVDAAAYDAGVRSFLTGLLDHYLLVENRSSWFPRDTILELLKNLFRVSNMYGRLFADTGARSRDVIALKQEALERIRYCAEHAPAGLHKTAVKTLKRFTGTFTDTFPMEEIPSWFTCAEPPMTARAKAPSGYLDAWRTAAASLKKLVETDATAYYGPYTELFMRMNGYFRDIARKDDVVFLEELNRTAQILSSDETVTVAEIYYRLAARFRHYLIDEFQDTSLLQWRNLERLINEALAGGGSLFYVGDRKQSIYRFRGGEQELFDAVPNELPQYNTSAVTLAANRRSQKEIVLFNNRIFSEENIRLMLSLPAFEDNIDDIGRILAVFRNSGQTCMRGRGDGYVSVERVNNEDNEQRDTIMKEKIIALVRDISGRFAYHDIAILTRENAEAERVAQWLIGEGIPVESEKTLNVFKHPRVKEIIVFLRFLVSPVDNISFAGFITGEIFARAAGVSQDEMRGFLFSLHADASCADTGNIYIHFRERYKVLWETFIEDFFKSVGFVSPYELTIRICGRLKVRETCAEDQAFFMKFLDLIHAHQEEYADLSSFLKAADTLPPDEVYVTVTKGSAIKILTVHKAKGLEFPVVIIPFFTIEPHPGSGGRGSSYFLDSSSYEGLRLIRITEKHRQLSPALNDFYRRAFRCACIDELNTWYVACTRPKYELYLFIPAKNGRKDNPALSFIPQELTERGTKRARPAVQHMPDDAVLIPFSAFREEVFHFDEENTDAAEIIHRDAIRYGTVMHALLACIGDCTGKDIDRYIDEAARTVEVLHGVSVDRGMCRRKLKDLLISAGCKEIFYPVGGIVATELEAVARTGETRRMDRVIMKKSEVWVIDFKSIKNPEINYRNQMLEYMALSRDIYPGRDVRAFIVYMDTAEAEEII